MLQPYFSIIIPCLNEEKTLPFLLKDIRKQFWKDYELIVVDGMSTDKTREIVVSSSNIKLLESTVRNVSIQRNMGAAKATGKYLIFFDADTRIPAYFLTGLAYQIQYSRADMFTCWATVAENKRQNKMVASLLNMGMELGKFVDNPEVVGAMMGFKRKVFKALKGFNADITFAEDVELCKRGFERGFRFELFRNPRYIYSLRRYHAEGTIAMLQTYAKLHSRILLRGFPTNDLDNVYPMMGGSLYMAQKYKDGFLARMERNIDKARSLVNVKKWPTFWKRIQQD